MNKFLFWICWIRARNIIKRVKLQYPNSDGIRNEDPPAQSAEKIGQHGVGFLNQSLPAILQAIQKAVPSLAKTQLDTQKEISPQYNQLLTDLYKQFGPQLAKTGSEIESSQRKSSADTDVSILKGAGGEVGRTAESLDREFNPEYYASRTTASNKLGELLGSINLNDANPEAERLVSQEAARSGNLTNPNATNTVSNALSFGNELTKRRNALGQALNIASGFLPIAKSNTGIGFAGGTINRTPTGQGANQFAGVQGSGASGEGLVQNTFGQGVNAQNQSSQLEQQRRDWIDRVNESIGSIP